MCVEYLLSLDILIISWHKMTKVLNSSSPSISSNRKTFIKQNNHGRKWSIGRKSNKLILCSFYLHILTAIVNLKLTFIHVYCRMLRTRPSWNLKTKKLFLLKINFQFRKKSKYSSWTRAVCNSLEITTFILFPMLLMLINSRKHKNRRISKRKTLNFNIHLCEKVWPTWPFMFLNN